MSDDDWDDSSAMPSANNGVNAPEGGIKFWSGRGFQPVEATSSSWDDPAEGAAQDSGRGDGWDDAPGDSFNNNYSNGGGDGYERRGGGRGGRGGGGGGRRPYGDDDNNGRSFGGDENGGFGRGRGRGRGGRGGDRGGGGRGRGDRNGGDNFSEDKNSESKPTTEIYIPPEGVSDEQLFETTISCGINFMKLDDIEVNVSGENPPKPIATFQESGLRPHLLENVTKSRYSNPTPIQKYAIPIIMSGRDLMGCAQTGSGKTAAFLLPMINKLLAGQEGPVTQENCAEPQVVVVAPTRELVIQICEQAKKFAFNSIVKVEEAYGGTSTMYQKGRILRGCHILVATPGRLNDFVKRNHVSFASVQFFVLDEADRMLDMGFLPAVEEMLNHHSMVKTGERQTLMFSATFPEEVQHLAAKFLSNYIFVAVGMVGSASSDVEQIFHQVSRFEKRDKILEMLRDANAKKERTVVFVETKRNADFLATFLSENDIETTSIHGDRLQRERETALRDFKNGHRNVLVATAVAARGLDIQGVQHVINYDLPTSIDEYVHRIGRTGRVGNRGKASSFFDDSRDGPLAQSLAKILGQAGQEVPSWLSSGSFNTAGSQDNFGGRDVRGDDFGRAQDFNSRPAEEPEEEW